MYRYFSGVPYCIFCMFFMSWEFHPIYFDTNERQKMLIVISPTIFHKEMWGGGLSCTVHVVATKQGYLLKKSDVWGWLFLKPSILLRLSLNNFSYSNSFAVLGRMLFRPLCMTVSRL